MTQQEFIHYWDEYVNDLGVEPMFARCLIQWKEDQTMSNVTIALFDNGEENENYEHDDDMFFYVDGKEGFLRLLKKDNGEDFNVAKLYWCCYGWNDYLKHETNCNLR